jgi:hypothetical protein
VRNHPELKDSQIMRLVGTTKATIAASLYSPSSSKSVARANKGREGR